MFEEPFAPEWKSLIFSFALIFVYVRNRFLLFHDCANKYGVNELLPSVIISAHRDLTPFIHPHLFNNYFLLSSSR